MRLPLLSAFRALLCLAFLMPGSIAWATSESANILVQIETTESGLVGDAFSVMFIGKSGPLGATVSATPEIEAALPPGDYDVLVVRANDQKTVQVSTTVTSQPATVKVKMPAMSPDTQRMRLLQVAVVGAEPKDGVWFWQFVRGDQIIGSRQVTEPFISTPLPLGSYVIRLRRGRENQETRAALSVEMGAGPIKAQVEWNPRPIGDDAVARARIIPRDPTTQDSTDAAEVSSTRAATEPKLIATYDAQVSQIVVRLTEGAEALNGGTIWLTDDQGPGGLDVAFIDGRGEARFSTLDIYSDQLAVEVRDASGLNIRARTIVEDWK